jgi:hypothetical protein
MRAMVRGLVAVVGVMSVVGMTGLVLSREPLDVQWLAIGLVTYLVGVVTIIRVAENRVSWEWD